MKDLFICLMVAMFFICRPVVAQIPAFDSHTYAVGSQPAFVLATRVNGDNFVDLVSANSFTNTVTVLTNDGHGIFVSNATLIVGKFPQCIAAADVNGDGKMDLISADSGSNTLTVLTNSGGVFGFNATVAAPGFPAFVLAVDLDSDGKVDLAVANNSTKSVTIFTNNGIGVFTSNSFVANVGLNPNGLAAADFNSDLRIDLVVSSFGSNSLTVLTNNGVGIFGSNATLNAGNGPTFVLATDLNGDSKPDLVAADYGGGLTNTLTVLTNNGNGLFGANATLFVGRAPWAVAAADVNQDGKVDLISANYGAIGSGKTLTVLTGNGGGIFTSNATLQVGINPDSLAVTDVNNDGRLDFVTADFQFSTLTVLTQVAPVLAIQPGTTNGMKTFQISWSYALTNFVLQTNADLGSTNWSNPGFPVLIVNGTNQSVNVTSPLPEKLFFRLKQ